LVAEAAVSPASTSRGVRLLAASVRPVMVLVNPGPWWTLQTPSRPLTRAYASAIATAPPSCRDAMNAAPAATRELVTTKLPLPTRPKTSRTPRPASTAPTVSATVGSGGPPDGFGRGLGSRQAAPLGVPVPLQVEEGAAFGHHRIHDEEPLAGSADGPGVDGRQEGLLGPALLETVIPHPLW